MENNWELEKIKEELEESRRTMQAAIEVANIYYFEYFPQREEAAQYNGRKQFGLEEHMSNYPESWFAQKITHPDDEEILRETFRLLKDGKKKASCNVRNLVSGVYTWFHYNFISIYDAEGERDRVVCTAQDISDIKHLVDLNRSYGQLYARTPGWIFTFKNDVAWTMQETNPKITFFTGYTKEEFAQKKRNSIKKIIPTSYHDTIRGNIRLIEQEGFGSSVTFETPILHKNGSLKWMNVNLYWDQVGSEGILYVSCTDVTRLKTKENELLESNTMYRLTIQYANIDFWEYDVLNDTMYSLDSFEFGKEGRKKSNHFMRGIVSCEKIRADSMTDFLEMYKKLKQGIASSTADIWIRKSSDADWRCERITYALIFDENQVPYKAFGIGRDVTELKDAEKRILAQQQLKEGDKGDRLLLKTKCNITQNIVEMIDIRKEWQIKESLTTFADGIRNLCASAFSKKEEDKIRKMFSKEKLEEAWKDTGKYSFDYQRKNEKNRPSWVNVSVQVFLHPDTHEMIAFIYLYDVNAERKLTSIINRVSDIEFEVMGLIYTDNDEMECIRVNQSADDAYIDYEKPYDESIKEFINKYVIAEDKAEALKAFRMDAIVKELQNHEVMELSFGVRGKRPYQKKWVFTYFDEAKTTIIYTRADVTELFRIQEMQKEALKNALLQAEEANRAKTNFLSKMSHEIRTPMNAIIGMNALAAQVVEDPEKVSDCLSKIGISSRFLLSLINDILDMSRIESGKVIIKKEKFPFEELIHNINSIFYKQAEEKGIDYDCVIATFIADYYIGDAMKIQQILVNLLGNSIKFTNAGGKIQFVVRQERTAKGKAYMAFAINDTGQGISEDFQKKMFDPFEQGDRSITSPYKGTGLGLAIAKNLVSMMNGTIQVNSIEGIGTEIIVHVPLDLCEEEERYHKLKLGISLEKLKTLIVDDDVTICEHTKDLLDDMGMRAEWTDSGYRAVEIIQEKWKNEEYYDIILLDWKMPDMDGIETTRRIRKIVGDEVTIIVMTAYDWTEIESEAKKAGVNLLVTKPLFKSSLISAFETAFQRKDARRKSREKEKEYDFSGKRILLVEDHILNIEVAKRLLESKNAMVNVAEDGLRAIEMFTEAPDRYYDAILMDIRMPVMDGLTATKSIRRLHKPYAKAVPILAMSANAFEEDVNKSKAAGMNEHLSKPIEPHILYEALNKWMFV